MKRRILSILTLIFVIALTIVPFTAVQSAAAEETATYTFSEYAAGTQYAENEVHKLDERITVTTTNAHFTTQLRLYSSSTNNGYAIISSTEPMSKISVNAGYNSDTLNIYGSSDGENWSENPIASCEVTSSYADHTLDLEGTYKYLKLDVAGTRQLRITSMTITFVSCPHTNQTTDTTPATCTEAGRTTVTCNDCGYLISEETIEATGHNYVDGVCSVCSAVLPVASFVVPAGTETIENRNGPEVTLPDEPTKTGNHSKEYTFVGWTTSNISEDTTTIPTVYGAGDNITIDESTTFYAVYSYTDGEGSTSTEYVLTDLADIKNSDTVVITMTTNSGTVYALPNNGGATSPEAKIITVANEKISSDIDDTLLWNIENNNGNLIIYVNGSTESWLYCTSSNTGVRVGNNSADTFTIDTTSGYLKHTGTGRYVGVYTVKPDWRCYTNTTGNTANQTLGFYVCSSASATYYTTTLETTDCAHTNITTTTVDPTCTAKGYTIYTCSECGYSYEGNEVDALGHTYDSVVVTSPTCTEGGKTSHTCSVCLDSYEETVAALGHTIVDNVCTECGEEITDYSGRYYIATIRTSGNYWYMTSDLGTASTKRYQAVDTELAVLPGAISEPETGYVFVLVRNNDGTYRIYAEGVDGDNYLGWTSGNSGTLVAEADAKSFTIDVTEEGLYNIHFTDTKERYLSLNATSGNNYFAFYEGTQKHDLSLIPVKEVAFTGASLNIGKDLSIRYHVALGDGESIDGFSVRFTMNDITETATEYTIDANGKYVFTFCGIAPQCMGDNIRAELLFGDSIVAIVEEYSVKQYAISSFALYADNAELCQLLTDLLYYGAASQNYVGYKTDALVTVDATGIGTPSTDAPIDADKERALVTEDGADTSGATFKSAGVRFDYDNKIFAKLTITDVENVKVKIAGVELEIKEYDAANNVYIVYSDGISALLFGDEISFELYYNDTLTQTLTYTVNTYVWDKYNDATTSEIDNLTLALYRYGKSAVAYNNANGGN